LNWVCCQRPLRGLQRINIELLPPYALVTAAMDLAMVNSAQRNGIFIAHLSTHGALLSEFEVMRNLTDDDRRPDRAVS